MAVFIFPADCFPLADVKGAEPFHLGGCKGEDTPPDVGNLTAADADGHLASVTFPGLAIDSAALTSGDLAAALAGLG